MAAPFDPAIDLPPAYNQFQQVLAHRAIRQGRTTAFYGPRPLKRDSYVEFEGSYYRIQLAHSETADLPALVMSVRWEPGQTAPGHETVVEFSTLPRVDQLALHSTVYGGLYRKQVHPKAMLHFSTSPVPYPDGTRRSELAKKSDLWVRWAGRVYEITIHRSSTIKKTVHEYTAMRVAADAASFRRLIADRYIVRLDNLTSREREILDAAITGGYREQTQSPSSAWNQLLSRLRETDFPTAHYTWYIAYKGEWYRLILHSYEACAN